MPGCVRPSSGPITCTMPCCPLARSSSRMPCSRQFRSSADIMSSAITSKNGRALVERRDDVIDGGDRPLRHRHAQPARAQHVERLRRRDFVDQVEADEELCLAVRQRAGRCARCQTFSNRVAAMGNGDRSTLAVGYRYPISDSPMSDAHGLAATSCDLWQSGCSAGSCSRSDQGLSSGLRSFCAGWAVRVLQKGKHHERHQDLSGSRCVAGAMDLSESIYRLTQVFPDTERYGLISQLRRSAVSIPSNLAEGQARGTVGFGLHFLRHRDRIVGGIRHAARARASAADCDRRRDA